MITKERAAEILRAVMSVTSYDPKTACTPAEDAEIRAYWDTLPGSYCYADAVGCMAKGKHLMAEAQP